MADKTFQNKTPMLEVRQTINENTQHLYTGLQSTVTYLQNATSDIKKLFEEINDTNADIGIIEDSIKTLTDNITPRLDTLQDELQQIEVQLPTFSTNDQLNAAIQNINTEIDDILDTLKSMTSQLSWDGPFDSESDVTTPTEGTVYIIGAYPDYRKFMYVNGNFVDFGPTDVDLALYVRRTYLTEQLNVIRADIDSKADATHTHNTDDVTTGVLQMARGGTGAGTQAQARINLSIPNVVNNTWNTSTTDAFSADQGRLIHNRLVNTENIPHNRIPSVTRVIVPSHHQSNGDYTQMGIIVELDRPAPAGCFLQFHRESKKTGHGSRGVRRHRKAFRPIDIFNTRLVWNLPIPTGAMRVVTAPIRQLYFPPEIRGNLSRIPRNIYKALNWKHANKCRYRFSVNLWGQRGNVSADTVEIMQWVTNEVNTLAEANANSRLIARVY